MLLSARFLSSLSFTFTTTLTATYLCMLYVYSRIFRNFSFIQIQMKMSICFLIPPKNISINFRTSKKQPKELLIRRRRCFPTVTLFWCVCVWWSMGIADTVRGWSPSQKVRHITLHNFGYCGDRELASEGEKEGESYTLRVEWEGS